MNTIPIPATAAVHAVAPSSTALAGDTGSDEDNVLKAIDAMTAAFARGDIDTVMASYEMGAVVMGAPASPVSGPADLRRVFAGYIAAGVNFSYGEHEVMISGDLALHLMQWSAPSPGGAMSSLSVAVLRRQADGNWRMVIDHPFGDGVLRAASRLP